MANQDRRLRLLSRLREFRGGMDIGKYLQTEHRQNLKALEDALREIASDPIPTVAEKVWVKSEIFDVNTTGDVAASSVTFTSTGRPVVFLFVVDGVNGVDPDSRATSNINGNSSCYLKITNNSTVVTVNTHPGRILSTPGYTNAGAGTPNFFYDEFESGIEYTVIINATISGAFLEKYRLLAYEI